MKPRLILGMIAGGMAGVLTFMVTGSGLVATPSPGSIFAYMAVTPKGGYVGVLLGVLVAAAVSFAANSALLGFGRLEKAEDEDTVALPEDAEPAPVRARTAPARPAPVTRTPVTEV
jgi:PTS system mannitol-specific IIC component